MRTAHPSPAPGRPAGSGTPPLPSPRTATRTRLEHGSVTGRPLLRVVVVQLDHAAAPPTPSSTRIVGVAGRGAAILLAIAIAAATAVWPAPQPDLVTKMFRPPDIR